MNTIDLILEPLEARIAPASGFAIALDGHSATTTDSDGDLVTLKITKGTLTDANFTTTSTGDGYQLNVLDLSNSQYAGTDILFTAQKSVSNGGDGFVNVGFINAAGNTLGKVVIPGDVGQFEVGNNGTSGGQAIKSLAVGSIGAFGADTGATPDLQSNIFGSISSMTVASDMHGKFVVNGSTNDGKTGNIGSLIVGGSVIGNSDYTGWFQITGGIKTLKVGGDLSGNGISSGRIQTFFGSVGSAYIGGSLIGTSGASSGQLDTGGSTPMTSLVVKGSLIGGPGDASGNIVTGGGIKKVLIGGDLVGGAGQGSGHINAGSVSAALTVGGSIFGGGGQDSGEVEGVFKSVTVNGDVTGGAGKYSGGIYHYGNGVSADVKILGNVTGGSGNNSGAIGLSKNNTYGTIQIGGSLTGSGYDFAGTVSASSFKALKIGGSVVGGGSPATSSGSIFVGSDSGIIIIGKNLSGGIGNYSGVIDADKSLKSISIGGSILAGTGTNTLTSAVMVGTTLGSFTVGGDLRGDASHMINVVAQGLGAALSASAKQDLAIGKISIGGSVTFGNFVAGYNDNGAGALTGTNGDASIGSLSVGRDWIASSASAGINAGADTYFGGDGMRDDFNMASPTGRNLVATISSIVIKGQLRGTYATANDSFALQAEKIGTLKIGSLDYSAALKTNPASEIYLGPVFTMLSDIRAIEKP